MIKKKIAGAVTAKPGCNSPQGVPYSPAPRCLAAIAA